MKTSRASAWNVGAFIMLLSLSCFGIQNATACPDGVGGPTSFISAAGDHQCQTWTAYGMYGEELAISITDGSDVFSLDRSQVSIPYSVDTANFTITFTPRANAAGTYYGTLTCPCGKTIQLVGTVASSGVTNVVPTGVSFTVSPNPAYEHLTFATSGVRSAEIGIYDLLGKEIASSKSLNWELDASSFAPGAYIARITGESFSGDPFVISRRIIIER